MDYLFKKNTTGLIKWFLFSLLLFPLSASAENIDPQNNNSKFIYGENIGWLNAKAGGNGMNIDAADLTGYLWAENAGWINLHCRNNNTCAAADYGVKNNGNGGLTGYAWGENIGWVNFNGVTIDPNTGVFNGKAWGENIGWMNLGPGAFQLRTAWTRSAGPTVTAAGSGSSGGGGGPGGGGGGGTTGSSGASERDTGSCRISGSFQNDFKVSSLYWMGFLAAGFYLLRKISSKKSRSLPR